MSVVRFQNVSIHYGEAPVLRDVFFRLRQGDRVGLIGVNGSGKTTVLKLILGQEAPSEGNVETDPASRIGYFSQFSELDGEQSVQEVMEDVFADVRAMETELSEMEHALSDPDLFSGKPAAAGAENRGQALLTRQAVLLEAMDHRDGWTYPTRINTVLSKLGFDDTNRYLPISQLSGGWRNRASLAKLLLQEPDVLLLDEPTNYLDIDGLAWLEEWLNKLRGAILVVSHDRHFLDRVVNRIVEIENYHFQEYDGDFTRYVREKQFRIKTLQRQFQHEEELLVFESEAIADRREAAKNPKQALARKLADLKKRIEPRPVDIIVTQVYQGLRVPDKIFRSEESSKSYGSKRLFRNVSFEIARGDRLAIVGPNGCGKTTLLKLMSGEEAPDSGKLACEGGVEWDSFNERMAALDPGDTVTHAVNIVGMAFHAPRKQVNRFLSLLRFSELDLKQRIGTLSGGQKARIALAQCLLSGASLLLLDEPTNHLDVTSIQVMERALIQFPGAIVVISHDRFFIDKVATRLLVFEEGGHVRDVSGNWTIWQGTEQAKGGSAEAIPCVPRKK
jgi:ATP-binding cassette subfamily F protein 3